MFTTEGGWNINLWNKCIWTVCVELSSSYALVHGPNKPTTSLSEIMTPINLIQFGYTAYLLGGFIADLDSGDAVVWKHAKPWFFL